MFCAACFGDPTSPLIHGYLWGVGFLLVLALLVLGSFGAMFLTMRKRMKTFGNK